MKREDVLLTPEEIRAFPWYKLTPDESLPYSVIEAQLKKLVEWGLEDCTEHFKDVIGKNRFECWVCQNELKKLAGIE